MDAMEWGVTEEFKADFEGNILVTNNVLKMIKSRCLLTETQKKQITMKNLVKKTLLGILRNQEEGFDILMDALAKEEMTNWYFINKMKRRLQQKRKNHRRLQNQDNNNASNSGEVNAELSTTVIGVPNNTKPEVESLKSITGQLMNLRKDMDPLNLKSHMSLEKLHRETLEGREKKQKQKIVRLKKESQELKQESQEKDEKIQALASENKKLSAAHKQLKIENSRLQQENDRLRSRRTEELMNIDDDVHPPMVQNIITAKNIILN